MSAHAARTFETAEEHSVGPLARLVHLAFGGTTEGSEKWLRGAGLENSRVVRAYPGGPAVASVLHIPMAQFFGHKSVPMLGIAGVAVSPEERGGGHARWMMARSLNEARETGFALSTLYASTQKLYRAVGYEQAGLRMATKAAIRRFETDGDDPGLTVRALEDRDEGAIRACYTRSAALVHGHLDRGPYIWQRTRFWREERYEGFGMFDASGHLESYLFINQSRSPGGSGTDGEVAVSDIAFTTPRSGRKLIAFLARFGTMFSHVTLPGGPMHPLMSLTHCREFSYEKPEVWMLRVCDVKKAIELRGYPSHVKAALELRIHDEHVAQNGGVWTLEVERGRAEVRRESAMRPAIACDIRALAPLYSGLYTAHQLKALGWIEGDEGAIEAAASIFGGFGTPWLADFF